MYRRILVAMVLCVAIFAGQPRESHAGFKTSLSLGGGYSFLLNTPQESERIGFNIEGIVGWRIPFLSFDLGIFYDFLRQDFQLRPGLKVHLGWFYLRAAVPLAFDFKFQPDDLFNLGVLFGMGFEFRIKKFAILLEVNIAPFFLRIDVDERGGGVWLPGELRLGVAYYF